MMVTKSSQWGREQTQPPPPTLFFLEKPRLHATINPTCCSFHSLPPFSSLFPPSLPPPSFLPAYPFPSFSILPLSPLCSLFPPSSHFSSPLPLPLLPLPPPPQPFLSPAAFGAFHGPDPSQASFWQLFTEAVVNSLLSLGVLPTFLGLEEEECLLF